MDRNELLQRIDTLNIWKSGEQRAPHKPLLLLYALGRWSRGETGDIPFKQIVGDLTTMLKAYGPSRQAHHPEYPFWRLQNDRVWIVRSTGPMKPRKSNTDPPKSELLAHEARGEFTDEVKAVLQADPGIVSEIASRLLIAHFPDSYHEDILAQVGLTLGVAVTKIKRDPKFRQKVLTAYEYRCAVCGFDVRLGSVAIALDAANIRWHQAGGPHQETNGLALCVLHHKMFDLGAFTVDTENVLLVSDQAIGTTGFNESLLGFHGMAIRSPQRPEFKPHVDFLHWHGKEVFKGSARHRD